MALNLASLNQRYAYLLNLINQIISGITPVPTSSPLSVVLSNGNSAGTNDINMNTNDIQNAGLINLDAGTGTTTTINQSSMISSGNFTIDPNNILFVNGVLNMSNSEINNVSRLINSGTNQVRIGTGSGVTNQGNGAIAIGSNAGNNNQGANSIAIGTSSGVTNQAARTIVLNASGSTLNAIGTDRFFVNPIRNATQTNFLGYDTTTREITHFIYTPPTPNLSQVLLVGNTANNNIILDNPSISSINYIQPDKIQLTDSSSSNIINAYSNQITNGSGNIIDINCDSIQQWINTTCNGVGEINLDGNSNTLYIRNFISGGYSRVGTDSSVDNSNVISTDDKDLFLNSNTKRFFKFNDAGYGYKPRLVSQDQTIQRYMNYIVMDDGITNVFLDTYTNLLDSNTLLSDKERVGWSCKFCNMNNVDVTISNTDGLNYFSHYGGLSGSPYTLKKWAVVELTLLWSGNLGQYLYGVSQFN